MLFQAFFLQHAAVAAPNKERPDGRSTTVALRCYSKASTRSRTAIKLGALTLHVLTGYWFLERVPIPRFDRIFVLNSEEEEYVTRLAGKEKVLRLTMGIDFDEFVQTSKDSAREMLALAPHKWYTLFVGNLVIKMEVEYLLRAIPVTLKQRPAAVLLIVETGRNRARLVKLAQELGVDTSVEFAPSDETLPRVPEDALPPYYSAADSS
jgi:glycosyltransferase involved in cell wall biosynthesis